MLHYETEMYLRDVATYDHKVNELGFYARGYRHGIAVLDVADTWGEGAWLIHIDNGNTEPVACTLTKDESVALANMILKRASENYAPIDFSKTV